MGLDIHIIPDNYELLLQTEDLRERISRYHLSRTFCNLMCRPNVVSDEPELEQIGRITGVDITPILQMERLPDDTELLWMREMNEAPAVMQAWQAQADKDRALIDGNIDRVLQTLSALITALEPIGDLAARFHPTEYDTVRREWYFADAPVDYGDGYILDNFGQDLRNFQCYVELAKTHGARTVGFRYG